MGVVIGRMKINNMVTVDKIWERGRSGKIGKKIR